MAQSPYERGSADAYYRRPGRPHKWLDNLGRERAENLTAEEVAQYWRGFDEQTGEKEWR